MIAKLRGCVDSVGEDWVVLDVGGVGYLLYCSGRTLVVLPARGEVAELYVSTHVREDHIHLYGFGKDAERQWFLLLQTVQGVGARVALGILSVLGIDELHNAVAGGDHAQLRRVSGVGPKVANRIVGELVDKIEGHKLTVGLSAAEFPANTLGGSMAEAVSALTNLGYGRSEAQAAILEAVKGENASSNSDLSSLIHAGLKGLGQ
jgi:Holliday junction DNA helicase RuvA